MTAASIQPYRGSYLLTDFEHVSVADVMRPGVMSCPPETSLREVARMMALHRIHCVVVGGVEQDADGERLVWRLVSDLDVARAAGEGRRDVVVGDLASGKVVTVAPSDRLADVALLMARQGTGHVVVATDAFQAPLGVVSTLDVASALAWSSAGST